LKNFYSASSVHY